MLLAPILPGITDSEAALESVFAAAAEHGAVYFGAGLAAPGAGRKGALSRLRRRRPSPHLLPRYQRAYAGTYAPREYQARLDERVDRLRARYGFAEDAMRKRDLVPGSASSAESWVG